MSESKDGTLVINEFAFPVQDHSDAAKEEDRYSENIMHAANVMNDLQRHWERYPQIRGAAQSLGIHGRAEWVRALPRIVAKHYGVTEKEVSDLWGSHYCPELAREVLGDPDVGQDTASRG